MDRPITSKSASVVKFGKVPGEERGENPMDPPIEVVDDYFWIRDDKRTNKTVLDYLETENNYTKSVMQETEGLQKELYDEHISHLKEDVDSVPLPHGKKGWDSEFYYFTRRVKGQSYPVHMRINMTTKEEETLLDENLLAAGKPSFDLSGFEISSDHKTMSYGVDIVGHEKYKIYIIDIESKQEIEHSIPEVLYCDFGWFGGNVYYTQADDSNRVYQLWKYDSKLKESSKIYQDDDELNSVSFGVENDKKYLYISSGSYETSNYFYITKEDTTTVKQVVAKEDKIRYSVTHHEGNFFIKTNMDNSRNFKVMKTTPESSQDQASWEEFIPYDQKVHIQSISIVKNHLIVKTKRDGDHWIKIIPYIRSSNTYDLENSFEIEVDDPIKNIWYRGLGIYDLSTIVYGHNSLNKPLSYYKYDLESKKSTLIYTKEVPNYDLDLYQTDRIFAPSHDGVKVPISIIYRKDKVKLDGSAPLYLYGYGSYGYSVDPDFRATVVPLLDRGFVFAIGHVRGGSFLGYDWYEDGKMMTKMNTFLDFIACAEHLVSEKYGNKDLVAIEGRSAGGLLVGAAMTMRPDLFKAVVGGVPFVDVLNTMSDATVPLTTAEWVQWGNPNEEAAYNYMKKYCPYTNVKSNTSYPNLLALGGLHDPRVQYWEPVKFVAKLREHNNNDNLLLVKIEMEEGHFSAMDRYKKLREMAYQQAFVMKTFGML